MNTQDDQNTGRPPAPQNASDRAGWIAMMVVALLGALVLGWAASLTAG
ncbi:MAG: hypothetical protein H7Y60_12020 [Rhodospirillaceae bacterium]|nr:hypothetical protein [Rhodospirillales bacterium]